MRWAYTTKSCKSFLKTDISGTYLNNSNVQKICNLLKRKSLKDSSETFAG